MAYYHTKYNIVKRRKKSKFHRFVIYTLTLLIIAVLIIGYLLYKIIYHPNVWICENESVAICIPTNSTFENVKKILYEKGIIIHRNNFEWLAIKKKYPELESDLVDLPYLNLKYLFDELHATKTAVCSYFLRYFLQRDEFITLIKVKFKLSFHT